MRFFTWECFDILLDPRIKIEHTIDALFGDRISRGLPKDIRFTFSRKTGRIRTVHHKDDILCTLRIDGGLALSLKFAQILLNQPRFKANCLEVSDDAAQFVIAGRSVFCKHVTWCGKRVCIYADTPVLHQSRVIAVGRAMLSYSMISDCTRGVAVKVRDSLKSHVYKQKI